MDGVAGLDGAACFFTTIEGVEGNLKISKELEEEPIKFLYGIEADTWEEAMTEHHKRQGWEPYVPMSY